MVVVVDCARIIQAAPIIIEENCIIENAIMSVIQQNTKVILDRPVVRAILAEQALTLSQKLEIKQPAVIAGIIVIRSEGVIQVCTDSQRIPIRMELIIPPGLFAQIREFQLGYSSEPGAKLKLATHIVLVPRILSRVENVIQSRNILACPAVNREKRQCVRRRRKSA